MKYALCCMLVFLGVSVLAQQQGQAPTTTNPPYQTPPTFPEGQQTPNQQMPPDTQAPPPEAMSSQRLEGLIVDKLRAEPSLSGTNVDARVDDNSVVLTGTVESMTQHDLAMRIAQANAGDRHIVDKIKVKQQT
jgi:osmotically-inducible protein OsmY